MMVEGILRFIVHLLTWGSQKKGSGAKGYDLYIFFGLVGLLSLNGKESCVVL